MACKCVSKKVAKITLCIVLPILAISVVVLALFPTIYKDVLGWELTLRKGTVLTGIWKEIPLPIYEKFYFFNITNQEAFLDGTEQLNVTEVGPYTYKASWVKNDLQWYPNGTVSSRELRTYQFVPDMSIGPEEDLVYTLNGPLITASSIAKDYDVKLRAILSVLMGIVGESMVIKRSIKELVYIGYEDLIIKFAPIVKPDIPFKNGHFAWLYGKNATYDGTFTVFTGADDPLQLNMINNWNGEERLSFWKGDTCNMLNGTTIEVGPSLHDDVKGYTFFQSLLCRSMTLNYTEDVKHFGLPGKRFRPTYSILANSTENPDNYCFEVEKERPSGVLDVSACQFGAPVFISFPHFYLADPSYLVPVNGLNPNDEDHGSHLDVHSISGATIDAVIRLQMNVEVVKVEGIFQTYNVTKGILPVFWLELSIQLNQDLADFFNGMIRNPKIISYSLLGFLAGISLILAIVFLVLLVFAESRDETDEPLIDAIDKECDAFLPKAKNCYGSTSCGDVKVCAGGNKSEGCCKSSAPCSNSPSKSLGASGDAPDESLLSVGLSAGHPVKSDMSERG